MARTCPPPAVYRAGSVLPALPPLETPRVGETHQGHISQPHPSLWDWIIFPSLQVNLIFPAIYVLCSIFVTLVPMIASPVETGIGCAIIFSGVPVYFLVISDDYVTKPDIVKRFMGRLTAVCCQFVPLVCSHPNPFLLQ